MGERLGNYQNGIGLYDSRGSFCMLQHNHGNAISDQGNMNFERQGASRHTYQPIAVC